MFFKLLTPTEGRFMETSAQYMQNLLGILVAFLHIAAFFVFMKSVVDGYEQNYKLAFSGLLWVIGVLLVANYLKLNFVEKKNTSFWLFSIGLLLTIPLKAQPKISEK